MPPPPSIRLHGRSRRPVRRCLPAILALVAASAAAAAQPTAQATSFQPDQGNEPGMAIDGLSTTFWHSAWNPIAALPQSLTIDYGAPRTVASLVYQPRPGGGNGTVTAFAIATSLDGAAFATAVADGAWPSDPSRKFVNFAPVQARYVRFTVTAGTGGFASAAEVFCMPDRLDAAPPDPGRVSVLAPAYAAEIQGPTTIRISGPGLSSATVTCWKQGEGFGSEATVGTIALDAAGAGSIVFPADEFPHGPLCVTIAGSGGNLTDNCYLQLFNRGGVPWKQGLPAAPPAAAGMTLLFADDFDGPLSISSTDPAARYYDHKPPDGSMDFTLAVSQRDPLYFLINLATGGGWPVDLSRYGGIADMYVDYVRVYGAHPEDVARLAPPAAP